MPKALPGQRNHSMPAPEGLLHCSPFAGEGVNFEDVVALEAMEANVTTLTNKQLHDLARLGAIARLK